MSVVMHGLAWSELNYCTWFALSVSSLPLSVMVHSCHSCVNLSRLRSSGFTPTLRSGSSPAPTRQRAGISHARNFQRTFGLHEIFKCAHLKFTVYGCKQTYIHTTSAMQSRKCGARSGLPQPLLHCNRGNHSVVKTTNLFLQHGLQNCNFRVHWTDG